MAPAAADAGDVTVRLLLLTVHQRRAVGRYDVTLQPHRLLSRLLGARGEVRGWGGTLTGLLTWDTLVGSLTGVGHNDWVTDRGWDTLTGSLTGVGHTDRVTDRGGTQ